MLKIGATTRLADIAGNATVNRKYTALAQAAGRVATPHVRDMGTIGGNLAQLHRCWYFRKPENRFNCIRKGGDRCFAMMGDNRYHSIFGNVNKCIAVNISDTAPALIALNAKVVTNKRTITTRVLVDDGGMIVLGGLIEDRLTESETRVPLLGSIPVIGHLFKSSNVSDVDQELLFFVSPKVLPG